jgi:hypothetical protein
VWGQQVIYKADWMKETDSLAIAAKAPDPDMRPFLQTLLKNRQEVKKIIQ